MKRINPKFIHASVAVTLALLALGCGDDGSETSAADAQVPANVTYLGAVEGTDAYVALLSDGDRVAGYLCDGRKVSTWLEPAPVEEGSVALRSRRGEELGEARLGAESATGQIEIEGETRDFELAVASGGDAGLYRAAEGEPGEPGYVEAGWIVLADGSVRGAKNGFIDRESDFVVAPAPKFIDQEGNLATDLDGVGTRTQVQKLDAGFIDSESDL